MKTIVITGPSGSGKSYLGNKLSKNLSNSIVLKTDSYYKDNILIKFLSMFRHEIYDRPFSIKKQEINNTLKSIHNKDRSIAIYKYDFRRKRSTKSIIKPNYKVENQFLILEGIFAHRLNLNYQNTINILCEDNKEVCLKRRLKRDHAERGRNTNEVKKKFNKSWDLFYKNIKNYLYINNVMALNTEDNISYNKLVLNLKTIKNN